MENSGIKFETILASIERVIYVNSESGYNVLEVKIEKIPKNIIVVGILGSPAPGEVIEAVGSWKMDRAYGRQFCATFIKTFLPSDVAGIKKYLASSFIKGIGEHYADLIVNKFQENTLYILDNDISQLWNIKGIGKQRLKSIKESWKEQKVIKDLIVFLHKHGIKNSIASKIYKEYGENSISAITQNPYILSQKIAGISFATADKIALNLGIDQVSPFRIKAGILHIMQEQSHNGSSVVLQNNLIDKVTSLLQLEHKDLLALLQELMQQDKSITEVTLNDIKAYCLTELFHSENLIAKKLLKLQNAVIPLGINFTQSLKYIESKLDINLTEKQKEALQNLVHKNVVVITGGPGTGKTTLLNSAIKMLETANLKIALCAPTGKAAKRLAQLSGCNAQTIHRLFCLTPFSQNSLQLNYDVLIIDEMSMVNIKIMSFIMRSIDKIKRLILVGDVNQLPPIGAGNVLQDIIESGTIPVTTLDTIFRQVELNQIISNAHKINNGIMPDLSNARDFHFISSINHIEQKIVSIIEKLKHDFDPLKDIQIISPMQKGPAGAISLNQTLQKFFNKETGPKIEKQGRHFYLQDKVMQIVNNYNKDIYNGDVGFISDICLKDEQLKVDFDGQIITYDFNEIDQLTLSYANTVHKSQGSEYKVVILPLSMSHSIMLKRRLLYTAVTRAKEKVIIIGEERALALAIKSLEAQNRYSKLKSNLIELDIIDTVNVEASDYDKIFSYLNSNISNTDIKHLRFLKFSDCYTWQALCEEKNGLKYLIYAQKDSIQDIDLFEKESISCFENFDVSQVLFLSSSNGMTEIVRIKK